ncbi:MAG: hypothetical protein ACRD9S_11765 [Pyrinomonadaceae bacterium]
MKLCPQCDFIYEDDQSVCDMDGKELVLDHATAVTNEALSTPATPTQNPGADIPPVMLAQHRRRNFAVVTVVGFVLAALVIFVYLARTGQLRSRRGSEVSVPATDRSAEGIPAQSIPVDTSEQPSSDSAAAQTPSADAALPEESPKPASAQTDEAALSSSTSKESLAHTRLTPGPVSAGIPSGNSRGPVIVRLTNGASIRADEAWEKREGIWYRQGGVVTFLKRSQVRTIERLPSPSERSKSVPTNVAEKKETTADTKKESKVTSFFKKTGRILKKPFKF